MKSSIIIFVVIAGAWWLTTTISPDNIVLPSPTEVFASYRSTMLNGVAVTFVRAMFGFFIGVLGAYVIFGASYTFRLSDRLDEQFAAGRAIPVTALMPLFILWFGFSETGRMVLVSLSVVAFFLGPLSEAGHAISREFTLVADQQRWGRLTRYKRVVVPATLPSLLGSFRVCWAISLTVAIAADYMGASQGIGRLIESARVSFNVPAIFLLILFSAAGGVTVDQLLKICLRKWVHWAGKTAKG